MSKPPSLTVQAAADTDTDLVFVFQDSGKKAAPPKGAYGATVERFRKGGTFTGAVKSQQFLRFSGKAPAENALLAGLGIPAELTEEKARMSGGLAWLRLSAEKCKSIAIHVDSLADAKGIRSEPGATRLIHAFVEGMILRAYTFTKHKSKSGKEEDAGPAKIAIITSDRKLRDQLKKTCDELSATAIAVNICRDWSNEPSNIGTPEYFAKQAQALARQYGIKCKILSERDATREKMGLFIGVGAGSAREGKIVVLDYSPKGAKGAKTIAFVGKGVTFDSGGISIKPSMRMEDMKHDMTGAATLFGATILAAKLKVPNRIVTILAFTENMPDGLAIQPGNVLTARNGKTVEIINTDAEGRLILADVLDYAHQFKPDAIVDAATLTGAVGIALGKQCSAILGNDESLIEELRRAGDSCGERLWQLPLYDEYFDDMKSEYADMKNSANDSAGGTIRGAIFLKQFIRNGFKWAHLDIASLAWDLGHLPYFPKKGASGAFVRTLARFAADF